VSTVDTVRSVISHRGKSCLELHRLLGELQREVNHLAPRAEQATALEERLDGQARTIRSFREQLAEAKQIRANVNAKAGRVDEAEARAADLERLLAEQTAELLALRAFKANVTSVIPLAHQGPAAPLADRFEAGTPVRLGASPLAVTDPGHGTNADTQPIPLIAEPATP
jgi:predicted RNase H-like nuclease (RuvC/YqgF family)